MTPSHRSVSILAAAIALFGLSSSAWAADYSLRLAHQLPASHHVAQALETFADEVEADSDGRIDVEIFGAAQLYGPTQFHAAVARGQIEAASMLNLLWGGTIPAMQVFNIPYLITRPEDLAAFADSEAASWLDQRMAEKGVTNLAWLVDANNLVYTSADAPLASPDAFQGIKIRGLSKVFDAGLIAMGASPSTMPGSEVYQGLQTGVIDAAMSSASAVYARRYFEVQSFGVGSNLITVFQNVIVNPRWWNDLPDDLKEVVGAALERAEQQLLPTEPGIPDDQVAKLEDNGMQITLLDEAQQQAMAEIMRPAVEAAFLESAPRGQELLDLIEQR
ncbi:MULTISPECIES: TRAP transporter substrate-binding protein DctP [Halomonas]|uniref:TRAP transporter substrate-binding protein DctP n=1 Tax=Halomonas TaxID=2745 RepID=UPI001C944E55|nr:MULTISPECIES: TRAP transporter substrate-binding protein DctP [Halomonas]MBY5925164.1 TRAP transporter substrate-binding protein DctP [Halomonas sp. DP4Y7-2]MBY6206396.1 TRAP transporter substrate-binding protein DctP [Halomonas sp. DP3Y7-2]MBY6227713.1 TRAP transporter substrate-binding protein DctP [Halomonas sp. DP3Y7-1]MBY6232205.1 TRAP transporter substrate-binding protein DctP [Halomonas sp. DP4Y7-1]MCA0915780.1 TRAP transporter substrate-binding protein DctP [Halomonas denitrificans]